MTTEILLEQSLLLSGLVLAGLLLCRLTPLDATLSCLVTGLIASFLLPLTGFDTGLRADNIQPLIFFIILPLLIFSAAWHMPTRLFVRWLPSCFLLASIGVIISTGLTAAGLFYGINHPGFPWLAALIAGVMLSATDPVSVGAQLKQASASEDLQIVFEGESLLNDASVVVLFGVLLSIAQSDTAVAPSAVLLNFATVLLGGAVVGALCGWLGAELAKLLNQQTGLEGAATLVLLMVAFTSFYIAEHQLHVSGIMAVLLAGLIAKQRCDQQDFSQHFPNALNWLEIWLNGLVFVLLGLLVTSEMLTHQWLAIVIAIAACLVARIVNVALVTVLTIPLNARLKRAWLPLLSWGGVKGAIAIALALSLPVSLPYWWTIQAMVFGVVLFSLLVQGSTFGQLLKRVDNA